MADKVGDEFEGYVTGVSAYGLYLELVEHFVEGMVHVSTMADDYYRFMEGAHVLRGEKSGRVYRLGDRLKVQVIRVDLERRQIDLGCRRFSTPCASRSAGTGPGGVRRRPKGSRGSAQGRERTAGRVAASEPAEKPVAGAESDQPLLGLVAVFRRVLEVLDALADARPSSGRRLAPKIKTTIMRMTTSSGMPRRMEMTPAR